MGRAKEEEIEVDRGRERRGGEERKGEKKRGRREEEEDEEEEVRTEENPINSQSTTSGRPNGIGQARPGQEDSRLLLCFTLLSASSQNNPTFLLCHSHLPFLLSLLSSPFPLPAVNGPSFQLCTTPSYSTWDLLPRCTTLCSRVFDTLFAYVARESSGEIGINIVIGNCWLHLWGISTFYMTQKKYNTTTLQNPDHKT